MLMRKNNKQQPIIFKKRTLINGIYRIIDGGIRLCVNYKIRINKRLTDSYYLIQKIDEVLNSLRKYNFYRSKYNFYRLDLFKVYLHIPVDEQSS